MKLLHIILHMIYKLNSTIHFLIMLKTKINIGFLMFLKKIIQKNMIQMLFVAMEYALKLSPSFQVQSSLHIKVKDLF